MTHGPLFEDLLAGGEAGGDFGEDTAGLQDPVRRTLIAGTELEGVPGEVILQTLDTVVGWVDGTSTDEVSADLIDRINDLFGQLAADYPESSVWDDLRGYLARKLFEAGHIQPALDQVFFINSLHKQADAIIGFIMCVDDKEANRVVFTSFLQRFEGPGQSEKAIGYMQALYDLTIDREPLSPLADEFESMLTRVVDDYDVLGAWATSQAELHPGIDWNDILANIRDEDFWKGVPVRLRQYLAKEFMVIRSMLTAEPSTELVTSTVEAIDELAIQYPDAKSWDDVKAICAAELLFVGMPTFAMDFAKSTRQLEVVKALVLIFIESDAHEEALELAMSITDAVAMTEVLLWSEWADDQGMQTLSQLIEDDGYPIDRRITILETVVAMMNERSLTETVARYQELLARLRQQKDAAGADKVDEM